MTAKSTIPPSRRQVGGERPPQSDVELDVGQPTDVEKRQVSELVREFLNGFEAEYRQKIKERQAAKSQ